MDIRNLLERAIAIVERIAPLTPIKIDDALAPLMRAILDDAALFGWFKTQVENDDAGVLQIQTDPPVALQFALGERKINWTQLIAMLPTIIALVKSFR